MHEGTIGAQELEDGEFELILANRQLLSVFFIVVVLLAGVFFTMGYIVGRNSGPPAVDVASAKKPDSKPIVVDSPPPQDAPAPIHRARWPLRRPRVDKAQQPVEEAKAEPPGTSREPPARKDKRRTGLRKSPRLPSAPPASRSELYLQLVATA